MELCSASSIPLVLRPLQGIYGLPVVSLRVVYGLVASLSLSSPRGIYGLEEGLVYGAICLCRGCNDCLKLPIASLATAVSAVVDR